MDVYIYINPTAYFTINRKHYEEADYKVFNSERFTITEKIKEYPEELVKAIVGEVFPMEEIEEEKEFIIEELAPDDKTGYLFLLYDREWLTYRLGVHFSYIEWDKDIQFLRGLSRLLIYMYLEYQGIYMSKTLEELMDELYNVALEVKKTIKKELGKECKVLIVVPELLATA